MLSPAMAEAPPPERDFADLYRSTVAPLRRYLARMLGDPAEAQDIAHDAYVRYYRSTATTPADQPEALLYTTARRLAINRLKRRRIAPFAAAPADPDAASTAPGVAQEVIARQELHDLEQAIAALPPGCRAVLLLRKVELLSHRDIAARLGIAVSTVEKQHARALRLLRARLQADASAPAANPTEEAGS